MVFTLSKISYKATVSRSIKNLTKDKRIYGKLISLKNFNESLKVERYTKAAHN